MKIAVLGTGEVGRTIASRLIEVGHEVRLGSRTADNEAATAWAGGAGDAASHGTFADAAAFAEVVFNCTKGEHTLAALDAAGADNLAGKVLIDLTNPLDFSKGMPPSLTVCNTDSMAERIQAAHPKARVVKALNTMWNGSMVNPRMIEESHHTFICGSDDDAKKAVTGILEQFGWRREEVVDLGGIEAARGTEMWLPLWLRIWGAKGSGAFNLKLVFAESGQ